MNNKAFIILGVLTLLLTTCQSDEKSEYIDIVDDELSEATIDLRNQYESFIYGAWHGVTESELSKNYNILYFNTDHSMTGTVFYYKRIPVIEQGNKTFTEWELASTLIITRGTWRLLHRSDTNENVVHMEVTAIADNWKEEEDDDDMEFILNQKLSYCNDKILSMYMPFTPLYHGLVHYVRY